MAHLISSPHSTAASDNSDHNRSSTRRGSRRYKYGESSSSRSSSSSSSSSNGSDASFEDVGTSRDTLGRRVDVHPRYHDDHRATHSTGHKRMYKDRNQVSRYRDNILLAQAGVRQKRRADNYADGCGSGDDAALVESDMLRAQVHELQRTLKKSQQKCRAALHEAARHKLLAERKAREEAQIKMHLGKLAKSAAKNKQQAASESEQLKQARYRIASLERELNKTKQTARESNRTTRAQVTRLAESLRSIEDETEQERHALQKVARGIRMDTLDLQRHMGSHGFHCVPSHLAKQLLTALVDSSQQLLSVCGITVRDSNGSAFDVKATIANKEEDEEEEGKHAGQVCEAEAPCASCHKLQRQNDALLEQLGKQGSKHNLVKRYRARIRDLAELLKEAKTALETRARTMHVQTKRIEELQIQLQELTTPRPATAKTNEPQLIPTTTTAESRCESLSHNNILNRNHSRNHGASFTATSSQEIDDLRDRHRRLLVTLSQLKRNTSEFGERYMQTLSSTSSASPTLSMRQHRTGLIETGSKIQTGSVIHIGSNHRAEYDETAAFDDSGFGHDGKGSTTCLQHSFVNRSDNDWLCTQDVEEEQERQNNSRGIVTPNRKVSSKSMQRAWVPLELGNDEFVFEEPTIEIDKNQLLTPCVSRTARGQFGRPYEHHDATRKHIQNEQGDQHKQHKQQQQQHLKNESPGIRQQSRQDRPLTGLSEASVGTSWRSGRLALVHEDDVQVLKRDIAGLDSEIAQLQENLFSSRRNEK